MQSMMGLLVMKGSGSIVLSLLMMISFQVLFGTVTGGKVQQQQAPPPAIYVFGDGVLDVGNNNYLPSSEMGDPPRANHTYYGIDFPNSQATGRFSNGYNMADFIAKAMGFQISPPAYLSLASPINMEGFTGVNYASADAGIWNITNAAETIPLLKQVEYFAATRAQVEAKLGQTALSEQLSKSFFLIGVGTMDILVIRRMLDSPRPDNQTDVQHLVASYGAGITALYNMGARKFGIINVPPVGCGPSFVNRPYGIGGCDDGMNNLAVEFNDALKPHMAGLGCKLHGLHYSIADFYGFSNATFANATAAGFVNTDSACCRGPCMPQIFGPPCENRAQYWFWDEGYTTEQAARLSAAAFYDGPRRFTVPVNFKRLIEKK